MVQGEEPRTVQAAGELSRRSLCKLTLLGDPAKILSQAKQFRVDLAGVDIVNPATSERLEEYTQFVHEKRKHKVCRIPSLRTSTRRGSTRCAAGHDLRVAHGHSTDSVLCFRTTEARGYATSHPGALSGLRGLVRAGLDIGRGTGPDVR